MREDSHVTMTLAINGGPHDFQVIGVNGRDRLNAPFCFEIDLVSADPALGCPSLLQRSACFRGTTHLSVMDSQGNSAAMTVSNGEGCGCLLTDTGIMLNNVLGEEDINPDGFHGWQPDQRMTSMMAPSLIETPDGWTALGSGGSNRIRTALLQVISNLLDYHLSPEEAVARPRIHLENDQLDIEGIGEQFVESAEPQESDPLASVQALLADYPQHKLWQKRNLFFGGVHLVECLQGQFSGAGDPRRGGVAKIVSGN